MHVPTLYIGTTNFRSEAEPRPNVLILFGDFSLKLNNVIEFHKKDLNVTMKMYIYVLCDGLIHVVTIKNVHSSILS